MTEKEKKDYARMRIERDLKGSDNMKPYRKTKKASFLPPTPKEEEKMKKLDMYGNPLPGYKWDGNEIVRDKGVKLDNLRINPMPKDDAQYKRIKALEKALIKQNTKNISVRIIKK